MRRIYGNMSIARKMTAVFLAICFVALSLSSVTVSYAAMKNINRRTETFARAVNAQVLSNLEHFMESYQGLMLAVLVDSDVLSALARDAVPVSEQAGYRAQINRLLFRLTKMQPDLIYAGIALKNGQTFQTGATGETADLLSIMERDWMKQLLEDPQTFTVVPMHDGEYPNRYDPAKSVVFVPGDPDFRYTADEVHCGPWKRKHPAGKPAGHPGGGGKRPAPGDL